MHKTFKKRLLKLTTLRGIVKFFLPSIFPVPKAPVCSNNTMSLNGEINACTFPCSVQTQYCHLNK